METIVEKVTEKINIGEDLNYGIILPGDYVYYVVTLDSKTVVMARWELDSYLAKHREEDIKILPLEF